MKEGKHIIDGASGKYVNTLSERHIGMNKFTTHVSLNIKKELSSNDESSEKLRKGDRNAIQDQLMEAPAA